VNRPFAPQTVVSRHQFKALILAFLVTGVLSGASPARPLATPLTTKSHATVTAEVPISRFVRRIFEDSDGNLWFGTNGDGVARYDAESLKYFSLKEGFGGLAVRAIVQDESGTIWFGTERGLTKYDGVSFTTFNSEDGLAHDDVWSILIDRDGGLWIGTFGDVSFDGTMFTAFPLPAAQPDPSRGVSSTRIVHCIMQDSRGRIWFGTRRRAHLRRQCVDKHLGSGRPLPQLGELHA